MGVSNLLGLRSRKLMGGSSSRSNLATECPITGPNVIPQGPPPVAIMAFSTPGMRPTMGTPSAETGRMQALVMSGGLPLVKPGYSASKLRQAAATREGSGRLVSPGLGASEDLITEGLSTLESPQPETYSELSARGNTSRWHPCVSSSQNMAVGSLPITLASVSGLWGSHRHEVDHIPSIGVGIFSQSSKRLLQGPNAKQTVSSPLILWMSSPSFRTMAVI